MSWRDTLTEEERNVVEELRKLTVNNCTPKMLEDDAVFYRFAKARDFNLKDAETMIRNHLTYRKEYQIDTILTEYKAPEVLEKYGPVTCLGYDKEGDAVRYYDLGRCDAKGFIHSAKKMDLIKYNLQIHERDIVTLRHRSQQLGVHASRMVIIINFEKLTLATATYKKALDILILGAKIMQDNYPELIKRMYFINVSTYFSLVYFVVRPFFSPVLLDKCRVHTSDDAPAALLEMIDAEILPAFLGGNRTDPDGNPNCYSFIRWGRVLPEKYRMAKSEKRLSSCPGVRKLTVTRFSKSDVRFEVEEPDSTLEWEFETKSRDIGFGVMYQADSDSKPEELVPKQRIETDIEPEVGICKCSKAGTYIIMFDNSYSWLFPKDIFYRVRIVGPNEEETDTWT